MGFFRTSSDASEEVEKTEQRHDSGAPTLDAPLDNINDVIEQQQVKPSRWAFGILNDKHTDEVPGSVLLLSKASKRNEPLGLRHAPARTSRSSLPSPYPPELARSRSTASANFTPKKTTNNGQIILDPQPEESSNDPLNWKSWRRNAALLCLGFYCMLGGGMTPILAAGFNNVAQTYHTTIPKIALTTGLYMMGLGVGSVVMSPTAILFGKRPVYLATSILFVATSIWCAASPSYNSLLIARIFQGISVSPVECLPSASIAEIFFLHERAYRLGIYTLLLLGGKNLIPLVSAAIIESLGWRWVFWIVAIVAGFGGILLFLFVPETFWDRTPRPRQRSRSHSQTSGVHHSMHWPHPFPAKNQSQASLTRTSNEPMPHPVAPEIIEPELTAPPPPMSPPTTTMTLTLPTRRKKDHKVAFNEPENASSSATKHLSEPNPTAQGVETMDFELDNPSKPKSMTITTPAFSPSDWQRPTDWAVITPAAPIHMPTPELRNLNSPFYENMAREQDYFSIGVQDAPDADPVPNPLADPAALRATPRSFRSGGLLTPQLESALRARRAPVIESPPDTPTPSPLPEHINPTTAPLPNQSQPPAALVSEKPIPPPLAIPELSHTTLPASHPEAFDDIKAETDSAHTDRHSGSISRGRPAHIPHTEWYRSAPARSYFQTLRPYHGRLSGENWFRVAFRPFILFLYPAVLWSSLIYALSVGWLIVLSESVSTVYKNRATYHFTSLQVGLVYLSPFIGGILGTVVAGKCSDFIVRWMSRRNDGVYEPEFRLVMALPVAISTTIGLMGFGWSAQERDAWIVPTVFFGVISFGCTLGSTTAITFCVDSYRQYAGEALVTLNFSKNIFHGLVFSLFFTRWLEADGSKDVFLILGGIQLACCAASVPMYIYGKRARMWTVRQNLMEKF